MKKIRQLSLRVTDQEMAEWAEIFRQADLATSDGMRGAMRVLTRDGPEMAVLLLRRFSAAGKKRRRRS
jgi:hypothetical protein